MPTYKYLDYDGLDHFWDKINAKKQDKLTAGSNITISGNTISASQPTVGNGTLTIQKNGTTVNTFTANQSTNATANITVPTATSELTNDSNFIYSGQTEAITEGMIAERAVIAKNLAANSVGTAAIADGAVTTAKLADDAVGWKYLGCAHTETTTNQFEFTLPAQYDNYKIIASAEMIGSTPNNSWQTLSPLNGSTLLTHSGYQERVSGTSWSCVALSSTDYVSQTGTYGYFSVFHEVLSMRSRSAEHRHYMTMCVSGGGNTNGNTTRGNMHATSATEPTGFRLRMGGNYIRSGSIYVWGMNNPTS